MEAPRIHQTVTILYGAFLASSSVYVLVSVFLQATQWRPPRPHWSLPLLAGMIVLAVACAAMVLSQKRALLSGDSGRIAGEFRSFMMSRCILWFSFSEVPAILGFVLFILTGNFVGMLALVASAAVTFTLAKPSLSQLEELERRFDL